MKYTLKQASIALTALACLALPATAQNKGKALGKAVEATVGRKVAQQTVKKLNYDPVFGYKSVRYKLPDIPDATLQISVNRINEFDNKVVSAFDTPYSSEIKDVELVQVAPNLQSNGLAVRWRKSGHNGPFSYLSEEGPAPVVQAAYLWRLAHPNKTLQENAFLTKELKSWEADYRILHNTEGFSPTEMYELPAIIFANYLMDPHFTPKSYAQLASETTVYPKYVKLSKDGFPVLTDQAKQAKLLDTYLMLSNPKQMGAFNNTNEEVSNYEPFILTREEHAAANQLLQLRRQSDRIPNEPSTRKLLEIAYNRLETHTISYTRAEECAYLRPYPNYKNTRLHKAIKGKIDREVSLDSYGNIANDPHYDTYHLIVLHGMMGGVSPFNFRESMMVLDAFEKLCERAPHSAENLQHLTHLQKALQHTFWPYTGKGSQVMEELSDDPLVGPADFKAEGMSEADVNILNRVVKSILEEHTVDEFPLDFEEVK